MHAGNTSPWVPVFSVIHNAFSTMDGNSLIALTGKSPWQTVLKTFFYMHHVVVIHSDTTEMMQLGIHCCCVSSCCSDLQTVQHMCLVKQWLQNGVINALILHDPKGLGNNKQQLVAG